MSGGSTTTISQAHPMAVEPPVKSDYFKITCFYMGQGDCILIQYFVDDNPCRNIMIDCGTTAHVIQGKRDEIKDKFNVELKKLLRNKPIHHLIITHSDEDHHNRFNWLQEVSVGEIILGNLQWYDKIFLKPGETPKIEDISGNEEKIKSYKIKEYKDKWQKKYKGLKLDDNWCKKLIGLTLNESKKEKNEIDFSDEEKRKTFDKAVLNPTCLPDNYYKVCSECDVKIIAAEVKSTGTARAAYMNAASLVTVVQIGDKKAIFTGDSTGSTFEYILKNSELKEILTTGENVLLQIPHHGSASHDSHLQDFINAAKPQQLFSSVKFDEISHNLPRWEALSRWKRNEKIEKNQSKDHYIGYWITKAELKRKRVLDAVMEPPNPSDKSYNVTDVSLEELLKKFPEKKTGEETANMISLQINGGDRWTNHFALNKKGTEHIFVIQKTKKAITTNGSEAVRSFLTDRINENQTPENPIPIKMKELESAALNKLGVTQYKLDKNGIELLSRPSRPGQAATPEEVQAMTALRHQQDKSDVHQEEQGDIDMSKLRQKGVNPTPIPSRSARIRRRGPITGSLSPHQGAIKRSRIEHDAESDIAGGKDDARRTSGQPSSKRVSRSSK